jgi:hypothetical protein
LSYIIEPRFYERTIPMQSDTSLASLFANSGRYDIYGGVHKALRLFMNETTTRLGICDPRNDADVGGALAQLEDLLLACTEHADGENAFIHPALERVRSGSSLHIAAEHFEYEAVVDKLRHYASIVKSQSGMARAAPLAQLYRVLAVFVGDNIEHMEYEETLHNAELWENYSDADLAAIEETLVCSKSQEAQQRMLPWFIKGLNPPELAGMFAGMRAGMPPPAFQGILGMARGLLPTEKYNALTRELGVA